MRARNPKATKRRRKKILKLAKGYWGLKSKVYRRAKEAVIRAGAAAYRDRKKKKRDMRSWWIVRINAAARQHGLTYSELMNKMKQAGVAINRKVLAEMAVTDPEAFAAIVQQVTAAVA
ncbi:MAG: 50S ribosomal protein L20 [Armatimonadetes bacterium]|nr:50S ribosomal protein L20 [Armatimonadota bacterium]MDW8122627.1 50S ribosomal protein L20 [Armatimonadota bacterium]